MVVKTLILFALPILVSSNTGGLMDWQGDVLVEVMREELDARETVMRREFEDREKGIVRNFEAREKELREEMNELRSVLAKEARIMVEKTDNEMLEMKNELKSEIERLDQQEPPALVQCASREYAEGPMFGKNITYEKLTTNFTNGNHGTFDIETGTFEAATAGYYTVTYSGTSYVGGNFPTDFVEITLSLSGVPQHESRWWSQNFGENSREIGSRTLIVQMASGDTLNLYANHIDQVLYDIIFCVSLTAVDH